MEAEVVSQICVHVQLAKKSQRGGERETETEREIKHETEKSLVVQVGINVKGKMKIRVRWKGMHVENFNEPPDL